MSQDAIQSLLLNQTFKIYKSNSTLSLTSKLTRKQLEKFRIQLARYLYQRYQQSLKLNDSLIVQYESHRDILPELTIMNDTIEEASYKIQYLIIKLENSRLLPRQILMFVSSEEGDNTLVLNRMSGMNYQVVNDYVLELLEDINDYPLIIKPIALASRVIPNLINKFLDLVDKLGDLQLVYSVPSSRLRNFIIEIPKKDLDLVLFTGKLHNDICAFLYTTTKIRFENLVIEKFINSLINISNDGKFKLISNDYDLVWFLFDSIKSSI
ncbi:hypothetical protein Cantr_06117 [Candida viswanathii]|uniref:Uncharacterized protein n=1 Tax=Candida viswanathii TaxID=5486 RepID=A0A367XV99_9ASCO|nr:hypothetical protein Cantr_06117 [Candida viswanathii]